MVVAAIDHWALMHEHRGAPEPSLEDLVARMKPVDILLVEGFKSHHHHKIEVHRPAADKPHKARTTIEDRTPRCKRILNS